MDRNLITTHNFSRVGLHSLSEDERKKERKKDREDREREKKSL